VGGSLTVVLHCWVFPLPKPDSRKWRYSLFIAVYGGLVYLVYTAFCACSRDSQVFESAMMSYTVPIG
jgi:hypothetical protein